eukprot:scaffold635_cov311-Pinguiococcus_pyrenoidosus.AAC.4
MIAVVGVIPMIAKRGGVRGRHSWRDRHVLCLLRGRWCLGRLSPGVGSGQGLRAVLLFLCFRSRMIALAAAIPDRSHRVQNRGTGAAGRLLKGGVDVPLVRLGATHDEELAAVLHDVAVHSWIVHHLSHAPSSRLCVQALDRGQVRRAVVPTDGVEEVVHGHQAQGPPRTVHPLDGLPLIKARVVDFPGRDRLAAGVDAAHRIKKSPAGGQSAAAPAFPHGLASLPAIRLRIVPLHVLQRVRAAHAAHDVDLPVQDGGGTAAPPLPHGAQRAPRVDLRVIDLDAVQRALSVVSPHDVHLVLHDGQSADAARLLQRRGLLPLLQVWMVEPGALERIAVVVAVVPADREQQGKHGAVSDVRAQVAAPLTAAMPLRREVHHVGDVDHRQELEADGVEELRDVLVSLLGLVHHPALDGLEDDLFRGDAQLVLLQNLLQLRLRQLQELLLHVDALELPEHEALDLRDQRHATVVLGDAQDAERVLNVHALFQEAAALAGDVPDLKLVGRDQEPYDGVVVNPHAAGVAEVDEDLQRLALHAAQLHDPLGALLHGAREAGAKVLTAAGQHDAMRLDTGVSALHGDVAEHAVLPKLVHHLKGAPGMLRRHPRRRPLSQLILPLRALPISAKRMVPGCPSIQRQRERQREVCLGLMRCARPSAEIAPGAPPPNTPRVSTAN